MRNAKPMQWIEQREERQVLTTALFDRSPKAPWCSTAADTAPHWLPRLGSWLAARHPMWSPSLQAQPALVRQLGCRPEPLSFGDE